VAQEYYYVRITKVCKDSIDWGFCLDRIEQYDSDPSMYYFVSYFPSVVDWLDETDSADRLHIVSNDASDHQMTCSQRPSITFRFDDLSFATLFRLRFSSDFEMKVGIEAVFARPDHKTLFILSPDFVSPATGAAAEFCNALRDEFGAVSFHRDYYAYQGAVAPFALAVRHWLDVHEMPILHRADWCTFAALIDSEQIATFIDALSEYVVGCQFLPNWYLIDCVSRFLVLAPFRADKSAKELLRIGNTMAALER
jgi:hypothetical protein